MASSTFQSSCTFGMLNGPNFNGTVAIPPNADGNNYDVYAFNVPHGGSALTVDAAALPSTARFGGLGFALSLVASNGNATPSCVIKLKAAGPSSADLSYTISPGQYIVFLSSSFLTSAWTSITITPDSTADCFLSGINNVLNT